MVLPTGGVPREGDAVGKHTKGDTIFQDCLQFEMPSALTFTKRHAG